MTNAKPLSVKQLAVIDDLFVGKFEEQAILDNHNISRKLYDKWLADETFNRRLDWRVAWEYRRSEFMLAHYTRVAVSNLVQLTDFDPKKPEAARKACIEIIKIRSNLLAGTPVASGDNPTTPLESPNFSPETVGKILTVMAEEKSD